MAKKSREQVVYDTVYATSERLGYRTYDYLPPNGVAYPFVYVGELFEEDRINKSGLFGDVTLTVHVFHDYKRRREVTDMLARIKSELFQVKQSEGLYLTLRSGDTSLMMDDTTPDVLIHGIMDLNFTFY